MDFEKLQPLLQRVEDAHSRFTSIPFLPEIAIQLEKEVIVSSVHGTNTIEGAELTEEETAKIIETKIAPEEKEKRVLLSERGRVPGSL